MRRHTLLFRALKKRYALSRPRYSLRCLWFGGATFTMLIFTLLLITSGLMYFYYQKCQIQQRELEKWRAGIKVPQPAVLTRVSKPDVPQTIAGMPAPAKVASKPAKTPTPKPEPTTAAEEPAEKVESVPKVKQAAPSTPATEDRQIAEVASTKRPVKKIESAYDEDVAAEEETPRPSSKTSRTGSAIKVAVPKRTAAASRVPCATPSASKDEIGNFLRSR